VRRAEREEILKTGEDAPTIGTDDHYASRRSKTETGKTKDPQPQAGPRPNQALEPTPYSVRCAPAFGRGSPRAFGFSNSLDAISENCDLLQETDRKTGGAIMSPRLTQLLAEMTPQEQTEVEAFAAFLIVRRQLQQPQLLTDDISVQELTELVAASGSFDWLNAPEEDIYALADGEAVQWPSP